MGIIKKVFLEILNKIKAFLRPIYYNGSSITLKELELAKDLKGVLLDFKSSKLIHKAKHLTS